MKTEQVKIGPEGHRIDMPISSIEIPELRHIAEAVAQKLGKGPAAKIVETWQLAHDFKNHIVGRGKPSAATAGASKD